MTAKVIPLRQTFDPVSVDLTSPGMQDGRPIYFVDYVEADGCRAIMWSGLDYEEAVLASTDCAECRRGRLPIVDTANDRPG